MALVFSTLWSCTRPEKLERKHLDGEKMGPTFVAANEISTREMYDHVTRQEREVQSVCARAREGECVISVPSEWLNVRVSHL